MVKPKTKKPRRPRDIFDIKEVLQMRFAKLDFTTRPSKEIIIFHTRFSNVLFTKDARRLANWLNRACDYLDGDLKKIEREAVKLKGRKK